MTTRYAPYTLEISATVNGRTSKTTVFAVDRKGKTLHSDRADLQVDSERRKLVKRFITKLGGKEAEVLEQLEERWHAEIDRDRQFREQTAAGSPEAVPDEQAPSAATRLVKITLSAGAELTRAPDGQGYLTVTQEGRRETRPIRSRAVRGWLRLEYYKAEGRSAGSQAIEDAEGILEGMALCQGDERAVHVRIAGMGERIYLDLADAERRVVEIDRRGLRVVNNPPVLFRRPRGLLALAVPVGGGSLAQLRPVLNLASDRDWYLLIAWMLAAMRPCDPYPVLCLHGEQGAAKSTTEREGRCSLLDPSAACL
jgi:hypothetical protein